MNFFWKVLLVFVVIRYGFFELLFPWVSQWAVEAPDLLPAPAAALSMYTVLILLALGIYILSSKQRIKDFIDPIHAFAAPQQASWKKCVRWLVLVLIPLLGGWTYFD